MPKEQYSTMQTANTQTDSEVVTVLTKTDSRSSDTQKRMYASANGAAFRLLTRDAVTTILDNLNQDDQVQCCGRKSPTSVIYYC